MKFSAKDSAQKAGAAKMKVCDAATFKGHLEAKILVELLGQREVLGWNERLDFSDLEVRHRVFGCGALRFFCKSQHASQCLFHDGLPFLR
jgi:hypothetical protein